MEIDYSHKWQAFIAIALLTFGCYLDYTVVNVALPTIQKELHANLTQLQWVMNIYFLALCILATIMGKCGDLYGRRLVFYLGVGIFAFASLVAGFAATIGWLILGRFLQGIGAAIVFPIGPSLFSEVFPENERAKAIAWLGSLGGIALALGPVLGGVIVTYLGWRWIFFINIPIIILGYLFAMTSVKESIVKNASHDFDLLGMLFLTLTMGGIVLGLINSGNEGWFNGLTLTYLTIGIVSGIILYKIESKNPNPLIDFQDFSNVIFYAGAVLCFLSGVLSSVALFFDPLYLQVIRGQSPEFSGLVLFAIPIAVFVSAFFVGWLINLFGIINTIITGLVIAIMAGFLQIFFTSLTPIWTIIIAFILLGGVWGMGNTVPLIAAQNAVGPHRSSVATGTMITMFNVGGSIGLAMAIVVYHFIGVSRLTSLIDLNAQLNSDDILQLQKLISNPALALKTQLSPFMTSIFHLNFMQGFSAVMWFLFALCIIMLLSVLVFKSLSLPRD